MELEGLKRAFVFLKSCTVSIPTFVSDRHSGITKWIREQQPLTKHFFDLWHVAKSIIKRITKAGKENGCEKLLLWIKGIKNHLYWCATSTKAGFGDLILAKWKSFVNHVANKHSNHEEPLFKQCVHQPITEQRNWIKIGTYQIIPSPSTFFFKTTSLQLSIK